MPINSDEELFEILQKEDKLSNKEIESAKEYIDRIENINITNDQGDTPFILASLNGHRKIVEHLILQGANLNIPDKEGNTPIMLAALNNRQDIVELLISKGANLNLLNNRSENILDIANNGAIRSLLQEKTLRIDDPFIQSKLIDSSDILSETGVCYGLTLETVRWYMKHISKGENEEDLNVLNKLNRVVNNEKDVSNFMKRIALYHSEQGDIDDSTSDLRINTEYQKNNFIGSLPDKIKDKKFIGFAFTTFDNYGNADGGHIVSIRRIGKEEKYEVIDVNYGSTKCQNNDELNSHITKLLYSYQKDYAPDIQEVKFSDLEGIVKRRNWDYEPILDNESPEIKERKKDQNKSRKYNLNLSLISAIQGSPTEYIKSLINDQNISEVDAFDNTALHYAVPRGNSDIVELLVDKGALALPNNEGDTPLDLAITYGKDDIAKILVDVPIDELGTTSLMKYSFLGNVDRVEELLYHGGEVNKKNKSGNTALVFVAASDSEKDNLISITHLLIKQNSDLNVISSDEGKTPLMFAIENENYEIAKILLDNGANIDIKDYSGKKALDYAKESGNEEMTKILMKSILSNHIDIKKDLISAGVTKTEDVEKFLPPLPPAIHSNHTKNDKKGPSL